MTRVGLAPLAAALTLSASVAGAHPFEVTFADIRFLGGDTLRVDVMFHVDAMLAGIPVGDLGEADYRQLRALPADEIERRLEMVRRYFETMIGVRFDGQEVPTRVSFPARAVVSWDGLVPLPGHLVRLEGHVPRGARTFTFTAAPIFNQVNLRIRGAGASPAVEQRFSPLEESQPYALGAGAQRSTELTLMIALAFAAASWLRWRALDGSFPARRRRSWGIEAPDVPHPQSRGTLARRITASFVRRRDWTWQRAGCRNRPGGRDASVD
jgi:hypothetical protein